MATTLAAAPEVRGEAISATVAMRSFRARPAVSGRDAEPTAARCVGAGLTSGQAREGACACGLARTPVPFQRATVGAAGGRAHARHLEKRRTWYKLALELTRRLLKRSHESSSARDTFAAHA